MAFERLRVICQSGLVSIRDFRTNALNIFAAHEVTAFAGALRGACYWALPAAAQPIWRGRGGGGDAYLAPPRCHAPTCTHKWHVTSLAKACTPGGSTRRSPHA